MHSLYHLGPVLVSLTREPSTLRRRVSDTGSRVIQQTGLDLGLWFREGLCSVYLSFVLARLLLYFVFSAASVNSLLFSSVVASSRAVMAQSADAADTHAEAAASLASTAGSPRPVGPSAGARGGGSSGEPVGMSEYIVRWMSQMEGQVGSLNERVSAVSAKVDGLAASFASVKDVVDAASAKLSHLEIAMQQFIENQAAQGGPSRQGDDARERLLQKSQLSEDAAAWKKPNSRKHWFVRGRIPPNNGEAPADIQAFVGKVYT